MAVTIQGVNYYLVISTPIEPDFDLIPFDFGGKALTEMTIVVDTTLAASNIDLPEISSFNGVFGTTLKIIALTGATNDVFINTSGSDTIGSATSVTLSTDGANAIFTVASEGIWAMLVTA